MRKSALSPSKRCMNKLEGELRNKIRNTKKQANKHRKAQIFKEGDLVWVHLSKERFSPGSNAKLKQRGDGPFKIVRCLGNNAYKVELPGDYGVSATFNVKDLKPYYGENELNSWASYFQPRENDMVQNSTENQNNSSSSSNV